MYMAEQKTKPTKQTVESFLNKVESEQARDDSAELISMMQRVTGKPPKMWGPSIIGFGQYHYKYESGHEGDSCLAAFSPRKGSLTVYVLSGSDKHEKLLTKLGKHKSSKACLYIKKLADANLQVLEAIIQHSVDEVKRMYPDNKK